MNMKKQARREGAIKRFRIMTADEYMAAPVRHGRIDSDYGSYLERKKQEAAALGILNY